jgi:hypothetical protein
MRHVYKIRFPQMVCSHYNCSVCKYITFRELLDVHLLKSILRKFTRNCHGKFRRNTLEILREETLHISARFSSVYKPAHHSTQKTIKTLIVLKFIENKLNVLRYAVIPHERSVFHSLPTVLQSSVIDCRRLPGYAEKCLSGINN